MQERVANLEDDIDECTTVRLPSSSVSLHDTRNPFLPSISASDDDQTPRTPFQPHAHTSSDGCREMKTPESLRSLVTEDVDAESAEAEAEEVAQQPTVSCKNEGTVSPISVADIVPYQTETTSELQRQFRLLGTLALPKELKLDRHMAKLEPLRCRTKRKTLVLDLDDTLIIKLHRARATSDPIPEGKDIRTVTVTKKTGEKVLVSFIVRPYALNMLKILHMFYEIIVFTASKGYYAEAIIDSIDPRRNFVSYILHRSHCVEVDGGFVKDLRVVGNRRLQNLIVLDNSILSFAAQLDNGIYIPPFLGDAEDRELKPVTNFLKAIADVPDVRPYVAKFAGIQQLLNAQA